MGRKFKFETVEAFLARGGEITYLSREESGLDPFYGIPKKRVRKKHKGKDAKRYFNEDVAK